MTRTRYPSDEYRPRTDAEREARRQREGVRKPRPPRVRLSTDEARARDAERYRVRDQWRRAHKWFGKVMAAGGVDVIVRADVRDPGWRDAA